MIFKKNTYLMNNTQFFLSDRAVRALVLA